MCSGVHSRRGYRQPPISTARIDAITKANRPLLDYLPIWEGHRGSPDVADFAFGSPQEMVIDGFYLWVRSPIPDDLDFARRLAEEGVLVLPGSTCAAPGYLRVTITATAEMIERSLPAFEKVRTHAPFT